MFDLNEDCLRKILVFLRNLDQLAVTSTCQRMLRIGYLPLHPVQLPIRFQRDVVDALLVSIATSPRLRGITSLDLAGTRAPFDPYGHSIYNGHCSITDVDLVVVGSQCSNLKQVFITKPNRF